MVLFALSDMFSIWVSLFILFSIKELHVSLLHT